MVSRLQAGQMLLEAAQQSVAIEDPATGHAAALRALRVLPPGDPHRPKAARTAGLLSLVRWHYPHADTRRGPQRTDGPGGTAWVLVCSL